MKKIVIHDDSFDGIRFAKRMDERWAITFEEGLKMPGYLRKSLLLGCWEFIVGHSIVYPVPDKKEDCSLEIPTDYGCRGGVFDASYDRFKRTMHIKGYIGFGNVNDNPNPVHKFYFS